MCELQKPGLGDLILKGTDRSIYLRDAIELRTDLPDFQQKYYGYIGYPSSHSKRIHPFPQNLLARFAKEEVWQQGECVERNEQPGSIYDWRNLARVKVETHAFHKYEAFEVNLIREEYIQKIQKIKKYILCGDHYQANFTQCFRLPFDKDPYEFFCRYFEKNPADYFAYWQLPQATLMCTSPEKFFELQNQRLSVAPIKGTMSKKNDPLNLLTSEKDEKELNMIVDLFRNDLYKVCERESVRLIEHKSLLEMDNVYHLFSEIEAKTQKPLRQILDALFPSGSITGCPKIRSMQRLAELEDFQRGPYTGSIGYFSDQETLCNVAIRSIYFYGGYLYFPVGGGITWDSDPEKEYQETLDKAQSFFELVNEFL